MREILSVLQHDLALSISSDKRQLTIARLLRLLLFFFFCPNPDYKICLFNQILAVDKSLSYFAGRWDIFPEGYIKCHVGQPSKIIDSNQLCLEPFSLALFGYTTF